jgi:hypothetical protein
VRYARYRGAAKQLGGRHTLFFTVLEVVVRDMGAAREQAGGWERCCFSGVAVFDMGAVR